MQGTSWARGLELIGDDDRLVAHAGVLPLRLLAEKSGLRAGLSAAMVRRDVDPVYDRGQVLLDLGLMLIDGGEAISDFQTLAHLAPVIGAVPSTVTCDNTDDILAIDPRPGNATSNDAEDNIALLDLA